MEYKKIKLKRDKDTVDKSQEERNMEFDYLEWVGKTAIFQAPDTKAGKRILDNRRKRDL